MESFIPKRENAPDFSNPAIQKQFIQDIQDGKSLMQKELNLNQGEQNLLQQRISMMEGFVNELPASDPQYSLLLAQIKMDQIEMDELKVRETLIIQKLESI